MKETNGLHIIITLSFQIFIATIAILICMSRTEENIKKEIKILKKEIIKHNEK